MAQMEKGKGGWIGNAGPAALEVGAWEGVMLSKRVTGVVGELVVENDIELRLAESFVGREVGAELKCENGDYWFTRLVITDVWVNEKNAHFRAVHFFNPKWRAVPGKQ